MAFVVASDSARGVAQRAVHEVAMDWDEAISTVVINKIGCININDIVIVKNAYNIRIDFFISIYKEKRLFFGTTTWLIVTLIRQAQVKILEETINLK